MDAPVLPPIAVKRYDFGETSSSKRKDVDVCSLCQSICLQQGDLLSLEPVDVDDSVFDLFSTRSGISSAEWDSQDDESDGEAGKGEHLPLAKDVALCSFVCQRGDPDCIGDNAIDNAEDFYV